MEDIKTHGYVLTPSSFVGAEDELDDGLPFEGKFEALKMKLEEQFDEGKTYSDKILRLLNEISVND